MYLFTYTHKPLYLYLKQICDSMLLYRSLTCPKFGMAVLVQSSEIVRKQHSQLMLYNPANVAMCTVSHRMLYSSAIAKNAHICTSSVTKDTKLWRYICLHMNRFYKFHIESHHHLAQAGGISGGKGKCFWICKSKCKSNSTNIYNSNNNDNNNNNSHDNNNKLGTTWS